MEDIKDILIKHEGLRLHLYDCPAGKKTIGVGRNLEDVGISEEEAMFLFENDIKRVTDNLDKHWEVWRTFPERAQRVCVDLVFNIGVTGFMNFRRTRALMEMGEWLKASEELLDSKYAVQLPNRSLYNSRQLALCQENPQTSTKQTQD